jgi:hypothetical protein
MPGLLAHDHGPVFRLKSGDQTDFLLRTAHFVPRQPHAVGRSELRGRFLFGQLLRRNDIAPRRLCFVRRPIGFVECVDDQLAVDSHRVLCILLEEQQPPAEAALRRLSGRVEHGIGPRRHESRRYFRIGLLGFDTDGPLNIPFGELPALRFASAARAGRNCQKQNANGGMQDESGQVVRRSTHGTVSERWLLN